MPITLTTPFTWPNGTRLVVSRVQPREEQNEMTVVIDLRTPAPTNHIGSSKTLVIRNGLCDRVSRNSSPSALMDWHDFLIFEPSALTLAAGFDNAMAAWKAGANEGVRKAALETHLLSVGVIHASLTGT